jgi:hypothetical protein
MTLERFQGIVLQLGSQMFVRHYLWLNYPQDPQLMGIQLIGQAPNGHKRQSSCDCGACQKCMNRKYVAERRVKTRLVEELLQSGFIFSESLGIWTVTRSEEISVGR